MKRVTITFDYEGSWGMPHKVDYDLAAVTADLLGVLKKNKAKAVFFVSGKLIEEYPAVIKSIHDAGHEIGLHGYTHEHMHALNQLQVNALAESLSRSGSKLKELGIPVPVGFRAPYLMGPAFYIPNVYQALRGIGIQWISNREIRMPEELMRPDRLKWASGILKWKSIRNLLLLALNFKLITSDTVAPGNRIISGSKWLLGDASPFMRPEGIMEYPLTSPLDCDMYGLVPPGDDSGKTYLDFALATINTCYDASGDYFNINCHDWITGTRDRLQVFDSLLSRIAALDDAQFWLPGSAEGYR